MTAARTRPARGLWAVTGVVLGLMMVPVIVVLLFSLNSQDSLIVFRHFSSTWYRTLFHDSGMLSSLRVSIELAVLAAVISTMLGTALAVGMTRGSRRASAAAGGVAFLRLVTPETATAAALLLLFTQLKVTLSFWTILAGHLALCTAFVTVIVRSRLVGMNREVEYAAQDLGSRRFQAVWLVVLPPLLRTLIAAALLAFVLSFDDFVTTYFTSGTGAQPLPLRIYSMLRFGVTPEVNAAGVLMLGIMAIVLTIVAIVVGVGVRRSSRRPVAAV